MKFNINPFTRLMKQNTGGSINHKMPAKEILHGKILIKHLRLFSHQCSFIIEGTSFHQGELLKIICKWPLFPFFFGESQEIIRQDWHVSYFHLIEHISTYQGSSNNTKLLFSPLEARDSVFVTILKSKCWQGNESFGGS